MSPQLAPCDFCGGTQSLRTYPNDLQGAEWHACAICVRLIQNEDWNALIERIVAVFAALQFIPESEQTVFRHELANAFGKQLKNEAKVPRPLAVIV